MQRTLLLIVLFSAAGMLGQSPATTWNDDSCDIGVAPAATLLLPYFEVDARSPPDSALTTLFTVVNTSPLPQIAKITLWTDWAYPAITFSAYVTGYGVASVNLYDVLARGEIKAGVDPHEPPGSRSTSGNPNHLPGANIDCMSHSMALSDDQRAEVVNLLTTGRSSAASCPQRVGGAHSNAIGYATIDVVATCSATMPTEPAYYASEILFDNVLIGDWEIVYPNKTVGNLAGGNPLVHLRAIPEGGPAGSNVATNLPYTFYDRYTTVGGIYARTVDRRQPLPSTFAARWIQGGTTGFDTSLVIWREGYTGAGAACARYADNAAKPMAELIRFDEHENSNVIAPPQVICTPLPPQPIGPLPATSRTATSSSIFPSMTQSGDLGGWMYLNTSNSGSPVYSTAPGRDFKTGSSTFKNCSRQSQGWVSILMQAEGRYAVLFDAAPLGNGCSISPPAGTIVGPAPNVTP